MSDRQVADGVGAVELRGAWRGAAPSSERRSDDRSARYVDRHDMRAENSRHARGRCRQRERVGWKDVSADRTYIDRVGRIRIQDAQPRNVVIA